MIIELAAELNAAASTDAVPGAVELPIAAATEAPLLLLIGVLGVVLVEMLHLDAMLDPGPVALTGGWFYRDVAVVSLVLFFGVVVGGLLVHYDVTPGNGALLDPHSFLMTGEEMPPHVRWRGNPATEFQDHHGFAGAATIADARARG